ncbi:peptidoglycan-binding protein [Paenibacillus sp. UNC451MF]|uniref:peptidoglycan-binding protein n=1 Tax=Paenibacillus sp. UNC451MF TaxID=1449063 RepID=UPI00048A5B1C|nr:peptidoglycan-binding protein [Paenibacillus sp. UNC451MF]
MLGNMRKGRAVVILLISLMLFGLFSATGWGFGKESQGPDVYVVQGMLKSLGYYPGAVSGYYDEETAAGVKLFQKANGLPETGAVDDRTLQAILWAYNQLNGPRKPTPSPVPTPLTTPKPPSSYLTHDEQKMVDLINKERKQEGLAPLKVIADVSYTARLKSQDMVENNYFSHNSPRYGSPFDMLQQRGITYTSAGENIACNETVEGAHRVLMESPGHRDNILDKDYTHIGIGVVKGGSCGKMFTQQFIAN